MIQYTKEEVDLIIPTDSMDEFREHKPKGETMTPDQAEELSTSLVSCEKHHCAYSSEKECPYCVKEQKSTDPLLNEKFDKLVGKIETYTQYDSTDYKDKYTQLLEKHSKLQDAMMELQKERLK